MAFFICKCNPYQFDTIQDSSKSAPTKSGTWPFKNSITHKTIPERNNINLDVVIKQSVFRKSRFLIAPGFRVQGEFMQGFRPACQPRPGLGNPGRSWELSHSTRSRSGSTGIPACGDRDPTGQACYMEWRQPCCRGHALIFPGSIARDEYLIGHAPYRGLYSPRYIRHKLETRDDQ
jgi:hypothetical protein